MAYSVEYIYRVIDQYSAPLKKITQNTKKFQGVAEKASTKISGLGRKLDSAGQSMANVGSAIGGAALTAGIFQFAKAASTIEDSMADIERVTPLTGKTLDKFQETLQKMGRETGRSAEGLAAIAYAGGKLEVPADQLETFVLMVAKVGTSFDMADEEAGRSIGSIRSKLKLSVTDVETLMNRINFLADTTSASGDQMINIIERTSGTMALLNVPGETIAGWAAFANQVEVSQELAGSGINMMLSKMMKMPGMMEKMLADPKNAVINFLKTFKDLPEIERGPAILKAFGDEAGRFVMKAVGNVELLEAAMGKAASSKALGSIDREFQNILKRSSTAAKRIKETLIDISRAIGTVFLTSFAKFSGSIQKASGYVLQFVKNNPGLVKMIGIAATLLAVLSAIVVPVGLVFMVISAGLPILAGLAAGVGAITMPVFMAAAGIAALVTWLVWAYAKSESFRQAVSNLGDALYPLVEAAQMLGRWIGEKLGLSLDQSQNTMRAWGDFFAVIVNMVAGLIKGLATPFKSLEQTIEMFVVYLSGKLEVVFGALQVKLSAFGESFIIIVNDIISYIKKLLGMIFSVKNALVEALDVKSQFSGAWDNVKAGFGAAKDKAKSRNQDNKMEVSGQIGVSATGGSKVESGQIGLDTGSNTVDLW